MKAFVMVKMQRKNLVGLVQTVEGDKVNVLIRKEVFTVSSKQLELIPFFDNDIQAKQWEKDNKCKVPKAHIRMRMSEGNLKLKNTKTITFLQWNITAVVSCPYRTPLCEKSCYAMKAQKMYPTVKTRRELNFEFSKTPQFVNAMIEQIEFELNRKKNKGKRIFFRIHESGDFYSYDYLKKWHEITSHFKGNKQIVFMAYTKSLPFLKILFKEYGKENVNIVFKSSIWEDTKPKFIKMTEELGLSVFTAYPKGKTPENYVICPTVKNTSTCGTCDLCYREESPNIAIEEH